MVSDLMSMCDIPRGYMDILLESTVVYTKEAFDMGQGIVKLEVDPVEVWKRLDEDMREKTFPIVYGDYGKYFYYIVNKDFATRCRFSL